MLNVVALGDLSDDAREGVRRQRILSTLKGSTVAISANALRPGLPLGENFNAFRTLAHVRCSRTHEELPAPRTGAEDACPGRSPARSNMLYTYVPFCERLCLIARSTASPVRGGSRGFISQTCAREMLMLKDINFKEIIPARGRYHRSNGGVSSIWRSASAKYIPSS